MKTFFAFIILFIIIFTSCEKKDIPPSFTKVSITNTSSSKFHICAEVQLGNSPDLDHGFMYMLSDKEILRVTNSAKISLSKHMLTNSFCADLTLEDLNLYPDDKLYVSAYITNEKGTLFSNAVSADIIRVQALNVVPSKAKVNDAIIIQGKNFETAVKDNSVRFNGVTGIVTSSTSSELMVTVPHGIEPNYGTKLIDLQIKSGGQTIELNRSFSLAPSPEGFEPKTGNFFTSIRIYGDALDSTTIYLNDQLYGTHKGSDHEISVSPDEDIPSKKFRIYISQGGIKTEVPGGYFTMEDPYIRSFTPQICYPGSIITIYAQNENPDDLANKLHIGTEILTPLKRYADLQYKIPSDMPTGEFKAYFSNVFDTISLPQKIKIVHPEINGISASSGYINSIVTLTGKNFYEIPKIQFGNTNVFDAFYKDSTTVKFRVPGITPGTYEVFADFAAIRMNCGSFTVISPEVTSFSPVKGEPGTTLTISGKGFGNSGVNILFGNNSSYLLSVTDNEINVQVPKWLFPGKYLVKVSINGYTISNSFYFEVP